ncbi:osmotically inducible protein OsmC [Cephaloticoccus capnophilus]|uniref:Osmotically inducible protein OsmC n=1 Tax=Cephaloticoccus capnophilus TaxID=1548208 RepID=A0A139SS72_9BACT|nr:OsmC family protein [Cephaloticoccus capnophilus]KXU37408.1 osmotically inducible protein OsmC [Cephaloticoccus capnophilus]
MVKSTGIYRGGLNCELTHGPSGQVVPTDAPVDNQGRGAAFSPTDLTAASLGACIVTTLAIVARTRLGLDDAMLAGTRWEVTKEMSADAPRRIVRLTTELWLPIPQDHPAARVLEHAARNCPVSNSLHPDIEKPVTIHWGAQ